MLALILKRRAGILSRKLKSSQDEVSAEDCSSLIDIDRYLQDHFLSVPRVGNTHSNFMLSKGEESQEKKHYTALQSDRVF